MYIDIITPFPKMIEGFFSESILNKALGKNLVSIKLWDLRDFTVDKHKTVDDYPYGGGPGMILKPEPIFKAVKAIKKEKKRTNPRIILMTPQGKSYNQDIAKKLTAEDHLIFICGHYRGVDERVVEALVTDEISLGDYILTGGEIAAVVVIDSVVRLLPGVLGDFDSAEGDSFADGKLDHPHYTRPAEFQGLKVPEVLLSGHHAEINEWRENQKNQRTAKRRPDLLRN
ncbi:tRNA (guanosine(37)-N1)-methyltransferase TrmD [bacterium]